MCWRWRWWQCRALHCTPPGAIRDEDLLHDLRTGKVIERGDIPQERMLINKRKAKKDKKAMKQAAKGQRQPMKTAGRPQQQQAPTPAQTAPQRVPAPAGGGATTLVSRVSVNLPELNAVILISSGALSHFHSAFVPPADETPEAVCANSLSSASTRPNASSLPGHACELALARCGASASPARLAMLANPYAAPLLLFSIAW